MSRRKVQDPVDVLVIGYEGLTAMQRFAFITGIRASDRAKGLPTVEYSKVAAEQPRKVGKPRKAAETPASEPKGE